MTRASESRRVVHIDLFSHIVRTVISAVLIAIAVGTGVYVGFSQAMSDAGQSSQFRFRNDTYLDIGDRIPDYRVRDLTRGTTSSLSAIVSGSPTVLLYMSQSCSACNALASYWNRKVIPRIRSDILIVSLYGEEESESLEHLDSTFFITSSRPYTIDKSVTIGDDGIVSTPTLVVIDADMMVRLVVSGFDRYANAAQIESRI